MLQKKKSLGTLITSRNKYKMLKIKSDSNELNILPCSYLSICESSRNYDKRKNRGERRRKGGTFWVMTFVSQVTVIHDGAQLSGRTLVSPWEWWMNSLLCFVHVDLVLPNKLSLSQLTSFLTFTLLIFSPSHFLPIPPGESEWSAMWGWAAYWG